MPTCGLKINLFLEVVARRPDGYHDLDTVFLRVGGGDHMNIQYRDEPGIQVQFDPPLDPPTQTTTLHKAYAWAQLTWGWQQGLRVKVSKIVPPQTGLGAGSANAAELIRWILRAHRPAGSLTQSELKSTATIGADVPPLLFEAALTHGQGVGEQLNVLPPPPRWHIGIAVPHARISTGAAFGALNLDARTVVHSSGPLREAIASGRSIRGLGFNRFEAGAEAAGVPVSALKSVFDQSGAELSLMSGSGSAVFGLFRQQADLDAAVAAVLFRDDVAAAWKTHGLWLHSEYPKLSEPGTQSGSAAR